MKLTQTLLTAAAISCFAYTASAQTTFVFDDGSSTGAAGLALEGESSTTYTQDGIQLTASTDFGVFNLTNSGFGPNDTGSGDDTDFFDGSESMVFSFNVAGTFNSIDFASLDDTPETAVLSFAGGNTYNLLDGVTSSVTVSGNDFFGGINESFTAGQLITLSISGGNGWTLENFTVVPEANTFSLLSGFAALTFVMLRRRSA